MLRKLTTSMLAKPNLLAPSTVYFSSDHHAPTPSKLQKVEQVTVKFNVRNVFGQWEQIHAFEGESFLDSILRMNVKGIKNPSICYGSDMTYRPHERPHDPFSDGPTCGMCRIILRDNWFEKIYDQTEGMTKQERTLLMKYSDTRNDLRLACCVPVEKWMDGCTFEIYAPPELSELDTLT